MVYLKYYLMELRTMVHINYVFHKTLKLKFSLNNNVNAANMVKNTEAFELRQTQKMRLRAPVRIITQAAAAHYSS